MDPLHTLKKFGIHDGHIEGDIEPANEKCHFPEDRKLKTTCKLVSIFSCCIESYDAAFQKKLICVVPCFLFPKLVVFWLKLKISLAKASDPFFDKKSKMSLWKYFWTSLHKRLKLVYLSSYDFISVQEEFNLLLEKKVIEDRSVWLEYSSKLLRFKRCCWKETKKFL